MPYIGNPSAQRFISPRAASVYSGDGSTTAFTLEEAVTTDEDILVSVDGVIQEPSVAYAVSSGTTLTFTAAPSSNSGNNIFVYYIARTFGSVSMPDGQNVNAAVGSFSGTLDVTGDFNVDSNTLFVDASENKVGVGGETSLLGTLHIRSSDASITSVSSNTDDLIIENNGNTGISIASSTSGTGSISFIDSGDTNIGRIQYDHSANSLNFRANDLSAMNINSAGIITQPLKPSFSAKASGSQTNIAVGSSVDVVLATEIYDRNADFASNVFTAPLEGLYQFNGHFYLVGLDSGADYIQAQITTSNRSYVQVFALDGFDQDFTYMPMTISVLADMDASDTAKLQLYQGGGSQQIDVDGHTRFTGYLVC